MADLNFSPAVGSISPSLDLSGTGLKPIDPLAREKLDAAAPDPFAAYPDAPAPANFDQFPDAPDAFAGFKTADDLDIKSADELNANREAFNPVTYFQENPNVAENPARLKKLLTVYGKRQEEGLDARQVIKDIFSKETGGVLSDIPGGIRSFGERAVELTVQPIANVAGAIITGDAFNKERRTALADEARKSIKKGFAEVSAGTESAVVGIVDLTRQGLRKLPANSPGQGFEFGAVTASKPKTDQELLRDISDDASFRQNAADILIGQGEAAKGLGLDKETLAKQGIELDENAIRQLSLVDPVTMVATGGAFKLVGLGGKVLGTARTLAGAKAAGDKLAGLAKWSAGKGIQYAGTATKFAGEALKGSGRTAAMITGVGASVRGAGPVEAMAAAAAAKTVGPAVRFVGAQAEHLGKALAGEVPISAAARKVLDYAAIPGRAAAEVTKGALTGIAAAAPFAVMADEDATAGALFGAGAALGAAGAAGAGTFRVVKQSASRRYFGENRPVLEDVLSPAYGKDSALDAQHTAGVSKLSAQDASELNNFREALRQQGGEIYAVDRATFRQKVTEAMPDATPEQMDIYENHSAFFDQNLGDRKVVYLNSDTTGLQHDAGHIFDAILSLEKRAELRSAVEAAFTPEQRNQFRDTYERRVGSKISDKAAVDEFIAEQFAALFNNVPVTELNAPKSLLNKFIDTVAEGAEALGIDLSAGATTPNLGAPVAVGIRKLFQNAAGDVIRANIEGVPPTNVVPLPLPPTPSPVVPPTGIVPPAGPAPVAPPTNVVPLSPLAARPSNVIPLTTPPDAPNIRVTPEQVSAFTRTPQTPEARAAAAARAAETGIEYARTEAKKAEGSPTSQVIERISDSMESGRPVVGIEHLGITSASTPAAPAGRTPRRGEQAAGYAALEAAQLDVRQNAPPEIVALHSKNFVPVRWTDQGGKPTLIAMSLDKVISNILKIAADPKAANLIPYEVVSGKLTPWGWREVVADAQSYSENQANGRKGDGGRLEVPEAGLSIPAENPTYTPKPLSPERANFQNLVQGLAPPQTSRAQAGVTPGNVKGQILAEANFRTAEIPANIPAKQAGKQAFVEFPPRVVQEVNPLRNTMERAGVKTRELLEVTERIRAQDIVSATPKPEINYKAPVTDTIRGGFQPAPTEFRKKSLQGRTVEEFGEYILKVSPEEWKAAVENMTGGLTGGAWNLGLGLKDAADLGVLQSLKAKASALSKDAMTAGDFDKAFQHVAQSQFFTEAYQAATNTGSAKAAFASDKMGFSVAKSPFPIEPTTTGTTSAAGAGTTESAKFLPAADYTITKGGFLPGETAKDKLQALWSWAVEKKFKDMTGIFGNPLIVGPTESPPGRPEILGSSLEGINFPSNESFVKHRLANLSTLSGARTGYQHLAKELLEAAREMDKNPLKGYAAGYGRRDSYGRPTLANGQIDIPRWEANNPALLIAKDKNSYRWENNYFKEPTLLGRVFNAVRDLFGLLKSNPDPERAAYLDRIYQRLTLELEGQEPSRTPDPEKFEDIQARVLTRLETELDEMGRLPPSKEEGAPFKERQADALAKLNYDVSPNATRIEFLSEFAKAKAQQMKTPDREGLFQPAEELLVGETETTPEPKLRVLPAAPGGRPPTEPPTFRPPPVAIAVAQKDEEAPRFLPEPSKEIRDLAKNYAGNAGLAYAPKGGYAEVKPDLAKKLADFYEQAKSDPTNPEVAASYDALIRETEEQGKSILAAGYKIEPWTGEGEPYKSSAEAIADVRNNKHLFFRQTSDSFGAGESNVGNPMLAESSLVPGQTVNDVFRWVHDFFGHSKEGFQFGPRGEFNAWRAHSEMYSPEAQGALAGETLAQNSWVNYGPHLEGKNIPLAERPFAAQKNVVVPKELIVEASFQPRTEAGRKLEERGFEIVPSGEMGIRTVTIRDSDGADIAQIQSVQRSPKKAEIAFVNKIKGAPAGLGEVLYREVGAQLKEDGVTLVGGQVVSPEPLAIRKKIFGGFKSLDLNGEPATYEQALATAERVRNRTENEVAAIEPVNEITAGTRFAPQQEMGFIRQGDAAIKVRDLERERNRIISELKAVQPKDEADLVARLAQVSRDAEVAWRDHTRSRAGFLPGKRDTQGRPLDKEGNIDYAKWQKEGVAIRKKQQAEPIEAAEPTGPVTEGSGVVTGWILPDKKFVPLDAAFHEQYLAENSDALNKKFKTEFSDIASTDDRLVALNAGFVRLRNQGGRLSIEANAGKWSSLKRKVLETLQDRAGAFDSLTLSLLNDEGQQVDSTSVPRLFEMSSPEKLNAIEEAVSTVRASGPRFQPADEQGLPGIGIPSVEESGRAKAKRRISSVKKNNPEAVTPQYARDESGEIIVTPDGNPKPLTLDYDFINSPVAKEAAKGLKGAAREEAAANALGDALTKLHRSVEDRPDIKAGAKWYSTARTRLRKVFGNDSKLFAELLGATSARTPVETNYRFALDAYNQFKAGAFDETLAKYREGKKNWDAGNIADFLKDTKAEEPTRGRYIDWWVRKHDLGVTQASGKKYGMNSRAVLRVLDGSWAAEVQGPKTPNFAGNLTGETFEATIDVWAARLLHRLANEGKKDRWRILPENETGVTDADFYLGQAAYRNAAKQLGIKPDALQAILWFSEKDHWEQHGWTRGAGAAKSDFNVLLAETERTPEGTLQMKTPQIGLDFGASIGDIVKKKKK